jgi:hypothetical protein
MSAVGGSVQMMEALNITVSIACPPQKVYDFIVDPENLPKWAPGFAQSVTKEGEQWTVATSDGPMRISFVERNVFGVADHYVTVGSDAEVFNPMRVIPNGDGAEVMFTLFRAPNASAEQFSKDARLVEGDLRTLKSILEAD